MKNMFKKAIVLIPTHTSHLSPFEKISLQQCYKVLSRHSIKLLCPQGMDVSEYRKIAGNIDTIFFEPTAFNSVHAQNQARLMPKLYEKISEFEYLLLYELDAFVFRDELDLWVNKGYDYVGAPWPDGCWFRKNYKTACVGNSGFSLRKISSILRALHSFSLLERPKDLIDQFMHYNLEKKIRDFPNLALNLIGARNNTFYLFNNWGYNEDIFWGLFANRNFPWFRVAPFQDSIKFSIELKPELLFKLNDEKLPFGCHAWARHNIEFWRPFIEREGYNLPKK